MIDILMIDILMNQMISIQWVMDQKEMINNQEDNHPIMNKDHKGFLMIDNKDKLIDQWNH